MDSLAPNIPEKISSHFAGLVDSNASGWFLNDLDEYFRGFSISSDDVVADIGCGEGAASIFCAKRGAKVLYADILESAVAEVTDKIRALDVEGEFIPLVCDSDPLLIEDQFATRVICSEVLEHVDDPQRVMSELVRIGRPGSMYLITVPGEAGEKVQQSFAPPEYFEKPNHLRIFSRNDFEALVAGAGLTIESYDQSGFFWVMWMSIHWAVQGATKGTAEEPVQRKIEPPFDDSLDRWASLWVKLISTPEGMAFKHEMDKLLPKNQIVIARKPA